MAEIVNHSRPRESGLQVQATSGRGAGFAGGKGQPGAKGGIEPFNVSGVEAAQDRRPLGLLHNGRWVGR